MHKQAEVENWLSSIQPQAALTPEEEKSALELLGHPGMEAVWSLMLGSRQALYAQLAASPLFDAPQQYRAAVLQGTIKGIELLHQTLLELSLPAQGAAEGAE